jgi:hypothetical protein
MPLSDYISSDEDERERQVRHVIFDKASGVLDADCVSLLREKARATAWWWQGFDIRECAIDENRRVSARMSFKSSGCDDQRRKTGETISGEALASISEYDDVEFVDVTAELDISDDE